MRKPVARISGPRRPVRSLPILSRCSEHGDFIEFWVRCPERGAIGLERCVSCRSALEIMALDLDGSEFVLRCQAGLAD